MKKLFFIFIILSCIAGMLPVAAAPLIKADADKEEYKPGDLVTVKIQVADNIGFHGLFFNLAYNSTVFSFEGISEGLVVTREPAEHKFRYAFDQAKNVVAGYTLKGIGAVTKETGVLAEIYFRVIDPGITGRTYQFAFSEYGIKDGIGTDMPGAVWQNSKSIRIISDNLSAYILIREPYDKQVFYTDSILVRAIATRNAQYTIKLYNDENGYISPALSGASGAVDGYAIPLVYGFNTIRARLFNAQNLKIAEHSVTVLRSANDRYVKIVSPEDHMLVNSDTVLVRVSSGFSDVTIDNLKAEPLSEKEGENLLYEKAVWLQRGFNRIEAKAKGPGGEIYTDSITVYYQKNDSIFRFLLPADGEVIKTNVPASLSVLGEIGSMYKSENAENRVTLKVIYHPFNPLLPARPLVDNEIMMIREADNTIKENQAAYVFATTNPINLTGLDAGKLEIKAYKNKEGVIAEDEITRFVYVDNNRLRIEIIQPHIYGTDTFNSLKTIEDFNGTLDSVFTDTELRDDGNFSLKNTSPVIRFPQELKQNPVQKVIECRDGNLLALVNDTLDKSMKVYQKVFGKKEWELYYANKNIFGYDLCETDIGILVGVSNRYGSNNSGLYLLRGTSLVNVILNEPITHVQFIVNHNGKIYLYGNQYSHLYSFNIFSLEEVTSTDGVKRLKTLDTEKIPFFNDASMAQFDLNDDCTTAVVRTVDGMVMFYQRLSSMEFEYVPVDLSGRSDFSILKRGEYLKGSYNAYVLISKNNPQAICVMEDKTTHRLIPNPLVLTTDINKKCAGIGFRDNNFTLVYSKGDGSYEKHQAQILFNTIYRKEPFEIYTPDDAVTVSTLNMDLLITGEDLFVLCAGYAGVDMVPGKTGIYEFVKQLPDQGGVKLAYKNGDIEGLSGFRFEIKPVFMETGDILFGFKVLETNGIVRFGSDTITLQSLLALKNDYFMVSHQYDTVLKKEIVHVDFNELQKESSLSFIMTFKSAGDVSPGVSNLAVNKKVPIKLPRSGSEKLFLPVKGYIYDPTAEFVYIQEQPVELERNGFFFLNLALDATSEEVPIRVYCTNSKGEYASLDFMVRLFDSKNDLGSITFKNNKKPIADTLFFSQGNTLIADTEYIQVSGKYYGLINATAGYETYA